VSGWRSHLDGKPAANSKARLQGSVRSDSSLVRDQGQVMADCCCHSVSTAGPKGGTATGRSLVRISNDRSTA